MILQWKRLEAWLAAHEPAMLADLGAPATHAELTQFEQPLGLALDADFVNCMRIHNGQKGRAGGLFDGYHYLPIRKILMSWETWRDLSAEGDFDGRVAQVDFGIRETWWCSDWIPFAANGGGDFLCLDMAPGRSGESGQVIQVFHDMPQRVLLASSFGAWFDRFVRSKTD